MWKKRRHPCAANNSSENSFYCDPWGLLLRPHLGHLFRRASSVRGMNTRALVVGWLPGSARVEKKNHEQTCSFPSDLPFSSRHCFFVVFIAEASSSASCSFPRSPCPLFQTAKSPNAAPCRKLLDKQMKSERRSFSFVCMPTE